MAKIRLFIDQPLAVGQTVPLTRDQVHYLFGVMRKRAGDAILVFDGRGGEFLSTLSELSKRAGTLAIEQKTRDLQVPPDLWLLFAPIKKARTDFIVEKATEMGAARIVPVTTDYTNADRVRLDRLQAHAVEAAEQCGGTFVPDVVPLEPLSKVLDAWPEDRGLMFCDETRIGPAHDPSEFFTRGDPAAILIGPEGGFSETERVRLSAMPMAHAVSLGPRVLRADTAAVAALTLWQAQLGDWGQTKQ